MSCIIMNKWLIVLISAMAGLVLFGSIGAFAVVATQQGEVLVAGDASESLTFRGEWDKYYDIYAEDKDIVITFETSLSHDPEFTYLNRCGVDDGVIGISGSCGDLRENQYLVADFSVEASGVGDVTLTFDGTGEVTVVESGVGNVIGSLVLLALSCCLCPILIIVSAVQLTKGKNQNFVIVNGGQSGYHQPMSLQHSQGYDFSTGTVQQNQAHSSQTPQKDFSAWDSPAVTANKPPAHHQPSQISGGYEWLESNGKMYFRAQGSQGEWNEFNG